MQHHTSHTPYDPDFDQPPSQNEGQDFTAKSESHSKNTMILTFALTPKKVFLSGLVVGALLMAIPTAFFAARATGGGSVSFGGGANGVTAPSAPTEAAGAPVAGEVKPIGKDDHVRGESRAKISVIEYSDIECPFCKRFHPTVQQLMNEYKGKVKWTYRHFPLGFHANAQKEAEATECAAELGGNDAFWKYLDALFERTTSNGTGFALDQLVPLAKELGLNDGKFKACLDGGKYAKKIQQQMADAQKAGVDGTPGTLLLSKTGKPTLVPGAVPYEALKAEVDKLLKE